LHISFPTKKYTNNEKHYLKSNLIGKVVVLAKGGIKIHKFAFASLEWSISKGYDY